MVLTRSQAGKLENLNSDAGHLSLTVRMATPDARTQRYVIGGVDYFSPVSYDDVAPDDFWMIASIPWFPRQAVLLYVVKNFEALERF